MLRFTKEFYNKAAQGLSTNEAFALAVIFTLAEEKIALTKPELLTAQYGTYGGEAIGKQMRAETV